MADGKRKRGARSEGRKALNVGTNSTEQIEEVNGKELGGHKSDREESGDKERAEAGIGRGIAAADGKCGAKSRKRKSVEENVTLLSAEENNKTTTDGAKYGEPRDKDGGKARTRRLSKGKEGEQSKRNLNGDVDAIGTFEGHGEGDVTKPKQGEVPRGLRSRRTRGQGKVGEDEEMTLASVSSVPAKGKVSTKRPAKIEDEENQRVNGKRNKGSEDSPNGSTGVAEEKLSSRRNSKPKRGQDSADSELVTEVLDGRLPNTMETPRTSKRLRKEGGEAGLGVQDERSAEAGQTSLDKRRRAPGSDLIDRIKARRKDSSSEKRRWVSFSPSTKDSMESAEPETETVRTRQKLSTPTPSIQMPAVSLAQQLSVHQDKHGEASPHQALDGDTSKSGSSKSAGRKASTVPPKMRGSARCNEEGKAHGGEERRQQEVQTRSTDKSGQEGITAQQRRRSAPAVTVPEGNVSISALVSERQEAATGSQVKRRRKGAGMVKVLFSHSLGDDTMKSLTKIVEKLGGQVVRSSEECTHFVAEKLARTVNMMASIAGGRHVVGPHWLESSSLAHMFLDPSSFVLEEPKKEQEMGFSLKTAISRARDEPPIKAWRVLISPNTMPPPEGLAQIVNAAGGQVVKSYSGPPATAENEGSSPCLVLATEQDKAFCKPLVAKGAVVYSVEFLMTAVLQHRWDFDKHRLFEETSNKDSPATTASRRRKTTG
eukprot:TRINITY_DN6772_c0_g6_i1.p1 TRINITY_DN6772_c0_g6~~TRINITY_DN6772_c0_g6_i1.p1  ORF type:complete len:788 (-),score=140.41 TRINITY_DN6772_c0_g6_i1:221-2356(-)